MKIDINSFGKYLKAFRRSNNLTQDNLANKLNLDRKTIINYESGVTYPTLDIARKLLNSVGLDLAIIEREAK